jgi:hypothetical protein
MCRKEAIFIAAVPLLLMGLGLFATILAPRLFIATSPCGNTIVGRQLSPDKNWKAVVFSRDCGATPGFSTHVSVLQVSRKLPDEGGNLFIADTDHGRAASAAWGGPRVIVRWTDGMNLSISLDGNAGVQARARCHRDKSQLPGHRACKMTPPLLPHLAAIFRWTALVLT